MHIYYAWITVLCLWSFSSYKYVLSYAAVVEDRIRQILFAIPTVIVVFAPQRLDDVNEYIWFSSNIYIFIHMHIYICPPDNEHPEIFSFRTWTKAATRTFCKQQQQNSNTNNNNNGDFPFLSRDDSRRISSTNLAIPFAFLWDECHRVISKDRSSIESPVMKEKFIISNDWAASLNDCSLYNVTAGRIDNIQHLLPITYYIDTLLCKRPSSNPKRTT